MKLTHLHDLQTATTAVACSRPKSAALAPAATGLGIRLGNGNAYAAPSWSVARKSMTVPTFHDRWPLCSPT